LCFAGFGDSDIYLQGNIGQQYLLCYYWMVATLTTNGQVGSMTPKSMLEVGKSTHHTPQPAYCIAAQCQQNILPERSLLWQQQETVMSLLAMLVLHA
jgi:hypothetical protein